MYLHTFAHARRDAAAFASLLHSPKALRWGALWGVVGLVLLFNRCANIVPLEGGAKDTRPPSIDTLHSSAMQATNFTGQRVLLTFDEWVKLDNAAAQLIISPPLKYKPEVLLRGRTVSVTWRDTLRPNTTYTLNFGTAVRDLTESNAATNLRYVFSTGAVIDTFSVAGTVVNAVTGKGEKEIWVMLYDAAPLEKLATATADSVVRRELPYYLAKTDADGNYTLRNLRGGRYKVFALRDANGNYRYDVASEAVGFRTDPLTVPYFPPVVAPTVKKDTVGNGKAGKTALSKRAGLRIPFFEPLEPLKVVRTRSTVYGRTDISLNHKPTPDTRLTILGDTTPLKTYVVGDTLYAFTPANTPSTNRVLLLYSPTAANAATKPDTVRVRGISQTDYLKALKADKANKGTTRLTMRTKDDGGSSGFRRGGTAVAEGGNPPIALLPNAPFSLLFTDILTRIDTSRIVFTDTAGKRQSYAVRMRDTEFELERTEPSNTKTPKWSDATAYRLLLLPNAIATASGATNGDTMRFNLIRVMRSNELGKVTAKLKGLAIGQAYILELYEGNHVAGTVAFTATTNEFTKAFYPLRPASYHLRLITDNNRNGRWDTGDYYTHRQPEPLQSSGDQNLRANWEIDLTMEAEAVKQE